MDVDSIDFKTVLKEYFEENNIDKDVDLSNNTKEYLKWLLNQQMISDRQRLITFNYIKEDTGK
tara:strand:- start:382 stop:570 length:189 start_codon:yes stop_codon:yes gene_type:complete